MTLLCFFKTCVRKTCDFSKPEVPGNQRVELTNVGARALRVSSLPQWQECHVIV